MLLQTQINLPPGVSNLKLTLSYSTLRPTDLSVSCAATEQQQLQLSLPPGTMPAGITNTLTGKIRHVIREARKSTDASIDMKSAQPRRLRKPFNGTVIARPMNSITSRITLHDDDFISDFSRK